MEVIRCILMMFPAPACIILAHSERHSPPGKSAEIILFGIYKDNFLSVFVSSCMLFNVTHQLAWFALASRSVHPLLTNCFSCWCAQSWRGAIWAKTPALLLALIVAGNLTESNHVGSELTTTSSEASGGFSFFCLPTFFVYELQFATSDIWHWFFIQFCK